jgi:hypothetical protein
MRSVKEINSVIAKRRIPAKSVMKKYIIPVNDLYGLAIENLQIIQGRSLSLETGRL